MMLGAYFFGGAVERKRPPLPLSIEIIEDF